jgi:hypothetical protein
MKELDLLALIWCIAVMAVMAIFILHDSVAPTTIITDPSGTYDSYEIEHIIKGYEGAQFTETSYTYTDKEKQEIFDSYRAQTDWAAEYDEALAKHADDTADSFQEAEEDRIEEYCDENGYISCYDIQYTCQEYACYLVTITCEDGGYSPLKEMEWGQKYGCDEWDVTVDDDSFDVRDVDESYYEAYGYVE